MCIKNYLFHPNIQKLEHLLRAKRTNFCILLIFLLNRNSIPRILLENKDFLCHYVKRNKNIFNYLASDLKHDSQIIYHAVKSCNDALHYASNELKHDRRFMLQALKNYQNFDFMEPIFQNSLLRYDIEFLTEAVMIDGRVIKFADRDIQVHLAHFSIKFSPISFQYIDPVLQQDRDFVLKMIKSNVHILRWVDMNYKSDPEFMLEVASINYDALG